MAHNDSDDKVDLAGEGLSADSQEPAAVEAANESASLRDRLLRALAVVENTRRRAERSVADTREYGISDFAAELLSVVDSLQRAIASAEDRTDQTPADAALLDGVRATQRQLLATLERFGVRRIEALGASFDPNFHAKHRQFCAGRIAGALTFVSFLARVLRPAHESTKAAQRRQKSRLRRRCRSRGVRHANSREDLDKPRKIPARSRNSSHGSGPRADATARVQTLNFPLLAELRGKS